MVLKEQVLAISAGGAAYPTSLQSGLASRAPAGLWVAGPVELLTRSKVGFFCSSQCPGSVVLRTFDAITVMRDEGQTLMGGFHSVMEWECLGILLRGRQPIIWVPARGIVGMHLKPELVPAFQAGRLLILSPFPVQHKRITVALAEERNRFVGALADQIFVPYARLGSKTAGLCHTFLTSRKILYTISDPANENLMARGACLLNVSQSQISTVVGPDPDNPGTDET